MELLILVNGKRAQELEGTGGLWPDDKNLGVFYDNANPRDKLRPKEGIHMCMDFEHSGF